MPHFLISSLLCLILAFCQVKIRLFYEERMCVAIEYLFIRIRFHTKKSNKQAKKQGRKPNLAVIRGFMNRLGKCKVTLNELIIPIKRSLYSPLGATLPYGIHGVIPFAIAYLSEKTSSFSTSPDSIKASYTSERIRFDLTLITKLYDLIFIVLSLAIDIMKERRKGRKNVG